jgi:beta-glucosidase-like glycosyl hydrolase
MVLPRAGLSKQLELYFFVHANRDPLQGYPPVNFDTQHTGGPLNLNVSVRSEAHTALVREIASASAVLLKNNRTTSPPGTTIRGLPLEASKIKTIAVVGQDAKMPNKDCGGGLNECNDGTMSIGCVVFLLCWFYVSCYGFFEFFFFGIAGVLGLTPLSS